MNAPFVVAQASSNEGSTTIPRTIKLAKPQGSQAVSVHLDGATKLDLSDIASEKLTLVRVGERLVILFDNQSTVTIEPFFDSAGFPIGSISVELPGDHLVSGAEFAAQFPITTDQSVLPAAGDGGGPLAGANFSDPNVDPLSVGTPLDLLPGTDGTGTFGDTTTTSNTRPVIGGATQGVVDDEGLIDGVIGGPGDVPGQATSVTGSLGINFGIDLPATLSFDATQPSLAGISSSGHAVAFIITTIAGQPAIIGYFDGEDPNIAANQVYTITLDTAGNGTYTFTLLQPFDHPITGTEDSINLSLHFAVVDSNGDAATGTFGVTVNDDSPDITHDDIGKGVVDEDGLFSPSHQQQGNAGEPDDTSYAGSDAPGQAVEAVGNLAIRWGADHADTPDSDVQDGASAGSTNNADLTGRAVYFSSNVAADNVTASSGEPLTSRGEVVQYMLDESGTKLIAYVLIESFEPLSFRVAETDTAKTIFVGDSPARVVFEVTLSDDGSGHYTFDLHDVLDHPGQGSEDDINLTFTFTARDFDGDPVSDTFTVTVDDDAPTFDGEIPSSPARFDEEGLSSTYNAGDSYGPEAGDAEGETISNGRPLGITWGADDANSVANGGIGSGGPVDGDRAVTFAATAIATLEDAELTSNGVGLTFVLSVNGTVLTAYRFEDGHYVDGQGGDAGEAPTSSAAVFQMELTDTGSGGYTFTLLDNLDHPTANVEDDLSLTFDILATDSDGDGVTTSVSVLVNDDAPLIGKVASALVDEDDIAAGNHDFVPAGDDEPVTDSAIDTDSALQTVAGSLAIAWGADEANTTVDGGIGAGGPVDGDRAVTFASGLTAPDDVTSSGFALRYVISDNGTLLTAYRWDTDHYVDKNGAAGSGDDVKVFTVALSDVDAGSFTFTLIGNLDHPSQQEPDTEEGTAYEDNIELSFGFVATDSDGDTKSDSFTVSVDDDVPVIGKPAFALIDEDDLSTGNHDTQPGDDTPYTVIAGTPPQVTGNLDIAWGADSGNTHVDTGITGSPVNGDRAVTFAASTLTSLDALGLTSDGTDLTYSLSTDGRTLTAAKLGSGETVFTVTLSDTGTGSFIFTLNGNLDHPSPDEPGTAYENDIKLTFDFIATDSDGDSTTASFDVTVDDDIPVFTATPASSVVDEDGLLLGNSGLPPSGQWPSENTYTGSDVSGSAIQTSNVSLNIGWGADNKDATDEVVLGVFQRQDGVVLTDAAPNAAMGRTVYFTNTDILVNDEPLPQDSHLTSRGEDVVLSLVDSGTRIVATAGLRVVFTAVLSDDGAGFYRFTLLDELDHPGENTEDDLKLTFNITARDSDHDSATSTITVTVDDDAPQIVGTTNATIDEDGPILLPSAGLPNSNPGPLFGAGDDAFATATAVGSLGVSWGADDANPTAGGGFADRSVAFRGISDGAAVTYNGGTALTSNGQAVHFELLDGQTVVGYVGNTPPTTTGDGSVVFIVTLSDSGLLGAGAYTFTLVQTLDHPAGGNENNINLDFGFTATDADGDAVNGSFSVSVDDDSISQGNPNTVSIDEESLVGGNIGESYPGTTGTNADLTPNPGSATANGWQVGGGLAVSWGADRDLKAEDITDNNATDDDPIGRTVAFAAATSGNAALGIGAVSASALGLSLTSDGVALAYSIAYLQSPAGTWNGGYVLTAYKTGGSPDVVADQVFKVTIDPTSTSGSYNFELLGNLDHAHPSNSNAENNLNLDFNFRAIDADGDVGSAASFRVTVDDDAPVIGSLNAPQAYSQNFGTGSGNEAGWIDSGGYGNISEVPNGTGGITTKSGNGYYALVSEAGSGTGPYTNFGAYTTDFVGGFKTSVDIYLKTTWAAGSGFDYSVAVNGQNGAHLRDFIFHITQDTSTGQLLIGASTGSNYDPVENLEDGPHGTVAAPGWYTFEHAFHDLGDGTLAVDLTVRAADGTVVFTQTIASGDDIAAVVGGNRYGWFPNIDVAEPVAIDNVSLTPLAAYGHVDEDDLANGTDATKESLVATGNLHVAWGADNADSDTGANDRKLAFTTTTAPAGLTSDGVAIVYQVVTNDGGHQTLTAYKGPVANGDKVFTVVLNDDADGSYTFTLIGNLDHPAGAGEADLPLTFGFNAIDSDGDAVPGSFLVTIADDVPVVGSVDAPLAYAQDFGTTTPSETGWFEGSPYGNITEVPSGTGGIATKSGDGFYAQVSEVGGSGPFTRFGGYGANFVNGFTTSVDVYLDINWNAGTGFDYSVAVNDQTGTHRRDFVFHVTQDTSTGDLLVGASTGSSFAVDENLENGAHGTVAATGWYTFEHVFRDAGDGTLAVDLILRAADGTVVFAQTINDPTDTIADIVGGNRYGWFTNIDGTPSLAIDNVSLTPLAAAGHVDEDDLGNGSDTIKESLVATGDLHVNWGADNADPDSGLIDRKLVFTTLPSGLTSDGVALAYQTVTNDGGHQTLTAYKSGGNPNVVADQVFTVVLNDDGSGTYTFTLIGNLDHPTGAGENSLPLTFGFNAVDADGDAAPGTFLVTVIDDVPTAVGDRGVEINEDSGVYTSNVLANDVQGADGAHLTKVTFDGGDHWLTITDGVPAGGAYQFTVTDVGVYTFKPDGTWTFTPAENYNGSTGFAYIITDGDGDDSDPHVTINNTVSITVDPVNDPPVISGTSDIAGAVTESGDILGIDEAGLRGGLEPTGALAAAVAGNANIAAALATLPGTPSGVEGVLTTITTELGSQTQAFAVVWDYLDDLYATLGPNNPSLNESFTRLGIEYADYVKHGGMPFVDVVAKFTADSLADADLLPERLQSMHDNLLGNLTTAALEQRFGAGSGTTITLSGLISLVDPDLLTRVYYDGGDTHGVQEAQARTWDFDNGFVPMATGQMTASDVDAGTTLIWSGNATGTYGAFAIDPTTGKWTYKLNDADADTQALKQGETVTDAFTATVTDEHGGQDTQTITITITGANDAPVIVAGGEAGVAHESGDIAGIDEAGLGGGLEPTAALAAVIAGNPTITNALNGIPGNPAGVATALAAITGALGGNLAQAIAVVWDYLDDAYQSSPYQANINEAFVRLGIEYAGAVKAGTLTPLVDVTAKFTADDNSDIDLTPERLQSLHDNLLGNLRAASLTQRFHGSDPQTELTGLITAIDPDLLTRDYYGGYDYETTQNSVHNWDIANGFVSTATGTLHATDVDHDATQSWSGNAAGAYGSFAIDANGTWTYKLDNTLPAVQSLAQGESLVETFTVTVTDDHGAVDTQTVTVTIAGTNDAPVITGGVTTTTVFESGDLDNVVEANVAPDSKFEPRQNLDSVIQTEINAHPTDMKAVLDNVQAAMGPQANRADVIAMVWDNLDDHYTATNYYNTSVNEQFIRLGVEYVKYITAGGRPLTDVVAKYTADGIDGDTDPDRLQSMHDNLLGNFNSVDFVSRFPTNTALYTELMTLIGTTGLPLTDRPIYSGNEGAANNALAFDIAHGLVPAAAGQLTATDVDNGHVLTWSGDANGTYGAFAINPTTGAWTYTLDDSRTATQGLQEGQTVTETFTATVTDEHGALDTQSVTVTVKGTNDAPSDIALDNLSVHNGDPIDTVVAHVAVTDVDGNAFTFVVRDPGGNVSTDFAVTGTPGHYELVLTGSPTSLPPFLAITATDSFGAVYTENFAVTLPVQLFAADHTTLLGSFSTIQAAVDAVSGTGQFIDVGAGTYVEQVIVDPTTSHGKDGLTITGIGDVTIETPLSGVLAVTGHSEHWNDDVRANVTINNSTDITIRYITIDGDFAGDTTPGSNGDEIGGIAYLKSSGTIDGVTVDNVSNSPSGNLFGLQHGSGILVDNGTGSQKSIAILDSSVTDFQKTGILIWNANVDIRGNDITGIGATNLTAQNAMQIGGSQGTIGGPNVVDANTFAAVGYTGGYWSSTDLIIYEPSGALSVLHNVFSGTGVGGASTVGIDLSDVAAGTVITIADNAFGTSGQGLETGIMAYSYTGGALGLGADPVINSNTFTDIAVNGVFFDPEFLPFGGSFSTSVSFHQTGSAFADVLKGSAGADVMHGGDGNDTLAGRGGADSIFGDGGDDTIVWNGGDGADTIAGGEGGETAVGDKLVIASSAHNLTIDGGAVDGSFTVYDGSATATASEIEDIFVTLSAGDDVVIQGDFQGTGVHTSTITITGASSDNIVDASGMLNGDHGTGADGSLVGINFSGGGGNDTFTSGVGNDTFDGGIGGSDKAVFTGTLAGATLALVGDTLTVTGPSGTDTFKNVEQFQFSDTTLLIVDQTNTYPDGYDTIADALAAAAGIPTHVTILVQAGTYNENLTIADNVTILGAQHGVAGDAAGRTGPETIINGQWSINGTAAVVLDGLYFNNVSPEGVGSDATLSIMAGGSGAGHVVTNTVFYSALDGGDKITTDGDPVRDDRAIFVSNAATTGFITIDDNLFTGVAGKYATAGWGRGIWSDGGGADLTISDNTFENTRSALNLDDAAANSPVHVVDNVFQQVGTAVSLGLNWSGDISGAFSGNDFKNVDQEFNLKNLANALTFNAAGATDVFTDVAGDGPQNDAYYITGGANTDTITGTAFTDFIEANGGNDQIKGGASADAIDGGAGTDTALYDASLTAANITSNGSGGWTVAAGAEGSDVLFNTEVVDGVEAGKFLLVGNGGYATIQAAVSAAAAGDTIIIAAGTWSGAGNVNIVIDKPLTIVGMGDGPDPAANTILSGGGFVVDLAANATAGAVSFQNLSIVGAGNAGISAQDQEILGTLSLDHVRIEDAAYSGLIASGRHASAAYDQAGVQTVIITNSAFVDNAQSNSNSANIMLFEFDGNVTMNHVTASNAVTGANSAAYGVQLNGVDGPLYTQKTPALGTAGQQSYDVLTPMGTVLINDLDITGTTRKASFYIQGYTDTTGLAISNSIVDTVSTAWGKPVVIDPMADQLPTGTANTPANGGSYFDDTAANGSYNLAGLTVVQQGSQVNELEGTTKADTITGTSANDVITGYAGTDSIAAGGGDDVIVWNGGDGADTITGGETNETAVGDRLVITSNGHNLTLDGDGASVGEFTVADGSSTVHASEVEDIFVTLSSGDNVVIQGDFEGTGVHTSTITITGAGGDETVDASAMRNDDHGTGADGSLVSINFTGGAGNDTLVVSGDFAPGLFTFNGASLTVAGPVGTDTITGVERIAFDDTTVLIVDNNPAHYDGAYTSIQAAITAAAALTGPVTIYIAAGTYNENVVINQNKITLLGAGDGDDVVIHGTFKSDNGIGTGSVADFLTTALSYNTNSGYGVTVNADNVTIKNVEITGFNHGVELGNGAEHTTIEDVTLDGNVMGIYKTGPAVVDDVDILHGTISDSYIGLYLQKATAAGGAGGGDAANVTVNGTHFDHITQKGIYAETLQGTTLFDNIVMHDVGQYGGGQAFGAKGLNGAGIDVNLKYGTYTGPLTIEDFTFTDVGLSNGLGTSHFNGAAIAVKARDDGPSYSGLPASFTGLVLIQDGSIDGTSTGIRVGEPNKNITGPAVTVDNVQITDALHTGVHGDIDNVTQSLVTVVLSDASETLYTAPTATGHFDISGLGGDDVIYGGRNTDTLRGGDGNDIFYATAGDNIVEGNGVNSGTDEVRTGDSFNLTTNGANVENLTLLDGAPAHTDTFENFDIGLITNGENGWKVAAGGRDQGVVDLAGNHVFKMSSDPSVPDFAGPYSFALPVTAGEPSTSANYSGQSISFRFKAVDPSGDNSRLEVDFGNAAGTDRNNFMVIESTAAGIRIAVDEPKLDGNWTTNDFNAFTGNITLASGASLSDWHQIELRLAYLDGPNNDVIQVYLDGQFIGTTTTFENYHDADPDNLYTYPDHATAAEAYQTNRIFFRPTAGSAAAANDGPGGVNEGFYFDDVTTGVYNNANATGNGLANVITGNSGDNVIAGLGGDDTLIGGAGNDTFTYTTGDGNDRVDGGSESGADTVDITNNGAAKTFNIGAIATGTEIHPTTGTDATDILVTDGTGSIRMDEIEDIVLHLGGGGDTVNVNGSLGGTALHTSTITVDGGAGDDTVDVSTRTSNHRVVADGGAGIDTAILGFASTAATIEVVHNANGDAGVKVTHGTVAGPVSDEFYNFENLQFSDGTMNLVQATAANLYFSAVNTGDAGPDMFKLSTDGTLEAIPLRNDAAASSGSHAGEDGGYAEFGGSLYFFADTPDASAGGLFKMDAAGTRTVVAGVAPIPDQDAHFTAFNGSLYFMAYGPNGGPDVLRLDSAGTVHSVGINPLGPDQFYNTGSPNPGFSEFDGNLYFGAGTVDNGIELYKLDSGGALTLIDVNVGMDSSFAGEDGGFAVFNGHLFFNASSSSAPFGALFELDSSGILNPVEFNGNQIAHLGGTTSLFHAFDGSLYFMEEGPFDPNFSTASTLYRLDTNGNVSELLYQPPGGDAERFDFISSATMLYTGQPSDGGMTEFNGKLYFSAATSVSVSSASLFAMDNQGHADLVLDDHGNPLQDAGEDGGFVQFSGHLYFFANQSTLYEVDSSGTATAVLNSSDSSTFSLPLSDAHFTVFNGSLYFEAGTSQGGELVRLDADQSTHVLDINLNQPGNSYAGNDGGFGVFPETDGTSGADFLLGTDSGDTLAGLGGDDMLYGGGGGDHFRFNAPTDGLDGIVDFSHAQGDTIDILGAAFGGLSAGIDLSAAFEQVNGAGNVDASAKAFVFDTASHTLYWNSDGAGGAAAVALAHLENGVDVTAADLRVV